MGIERGPVQLHLDPVMVRVPIVFRPPIAADQKVLGHEISLNGHCVHRTYLS
jgi:hypothetical protein